MESARVQKCKSVSVQKRRVAGTADGTGHWWIASGLEWAPGEVGCGAEEPGRGPASTWVGCGADVPVGRAATTR